MSTDADEDRVVRVSQKGQATIPKPLREKYGIDTPGRVRFRETEEGIVVEPVPNLADLRGVLANDAFERGEVTEQIAEMRGDEREQELLTRVDEGDATAAISEVTATEIVYKVARLRADGRPTDADLALGRQQVDSFVAGGIDILAPTASWPVAARVKAHGAIALGDAFAVALAVDRQGTLVVGADRDFEDLPVDVAIERIRTDPA